MMSPVTILTCPAPSSCAGAESHRFLVAGLKSGKMEIVMNVELEWEFSDPEMRRYVDGFQATRLIDRVSGNRVQFFLFDLFSFVL